MTLDVPDNLSAHLEQTTAEVKRLRAEAGALPAVLHYVARDEVIDVPVTDICDMSGKPYLQVLADVVPQIRARFGPAETLTLVHDSGNEIFLLAAQPGVTVSRLIGYDDPFGWSYESTAVDAPNLDTVVDRIVWSAFHARGELN